MIKYLEYLIPCVNVLLAKKYTKIYLFFMFKNNP